MQLPPASVQDMSLAEYDAALRHQLGVGLDEPDNLQEAMSQGGGRGGITVPPWQVGDADDGGYGFNRERAYAAAYARREGVRWISLVGSDGKPGGRAHEVISKLYRDQLVSAIENGETIEQLRSRFVFPDMLSLLERGEISDWDYMTWIERYLNRDFWRMATYEASASWNNGRLQMYVDQAEITGQPKYVMFQRTAGSLF